MEGGGEVGGGGGAETEEIDIEIEINDIDNNNGLVYPTGFYEGNSPLLFFSLSVLTPSLL